MTEALVDEHRSKRRKLSGRSFYQDVLGSPKFVVAPMVDQSELVSCYLARALINHKLNKI